MILKFGFLKIKESKGNMPRESLKTHAKNLSSLYYSIEGEKTSCGLWVWEA